VRVNCAEQVNECYGDFSSADPRCNNPAMARRSTDTDLGAADKKLLMTLEEWGWYVLKVGAGETTPPFAYSIGLFEHFKHPEIIIFGLNLETMHTLINDAAKQIQHGHAYASSQRYDDLLKQYECEFRTVNPSRYDGFLNYGLWFYGGSQFPALQLVWPDREGRFPWELNFDERFRREQVILE
jgi:hypothetical protein